MEEKMKFGEKKVPTVMDFGSFGLSIKQTASYWKVHPGSIWRLIKLGKLHASRIGRKWRISKQAIDKIESDQVAENDVARFDYANLRRLR